MNLILKGDYIKLKEKMAHNKRLINKQNQILFLLLLAIFLFDDFKVKEHRIVFIKTIRGSVQNFKKIVSELSYLTNLEFYFIEPVENSNVIELYCQSNPHFFKDLITYSKLIGEN